MPRERRGLDAGVGRKPVRRSSEIRPATRGKSEDSEHAPLKTASVGEIHFSDPYAPPVGAGKKAAAQFPTAESEEPSASPQGGFSLTAGREAPDAPFTGGLKLRF